MNDRQGSTPPALRSERILTAFKQILGANQPVILAWALLLATTLSWFMTASYELLRLALDDRDPGGGGVAALVIAALFFPILVGLLWQHIAGVATRVPVRIVEDDRPRAVSALILFLSPPHAGEPILQAVAAGTRPFRLQDPAHRGGIQGPWRMPIEALAYHRRHRVLRSIVLIPSPETAPKVPLFEQLVARLTGAAVEVVSVPGPPGQTLAPGSDAAASCAGVELEHASALEDAVEDAYEWLLRRRYASRDILIDLTGGQKVATIAGAAVALADDRHFQSVSTRDYRVRTYDITYLA